MICPNCGRETTGKFCPSCGTKLSAEPAAAQTNDLAGVPQQDPVPAQSNSPDPIYDQSQNQGCAQNQGCTQNQGYAQNQGYVPSQQTVGYGGVPAGAIGQTPAIQALRKLAVSPLFLFAVLLVTLSLVFTSYLNIKNMIACFDVMDRYKGSALESDLISSIIIAFVSVLLNLLMVIALWSIFASAANKNGERMRTGGLTFFQVIYGITLALAALLLCFVIVLLVMLISSKSYSSFFQDAVNELIYLLERSGYAFPNMDVSLRTFLYIFLGVLLAGLVLGLLFLIKLLKTLGTAKRVIRTGAPDDRVSVFVGVMILLGSVGGLISGIDALTIPQDIMQLLGISRTAAVFYGVNLLLSAVSAAFFAITLFRFRSEMRRLGGHKGVTQYQ